MEAVKNNRRPILIGLIALLLLCLVGVLVFNIFFSDSGGDDVAGGEPPTATAAPTEAEATDEEPSPTSTPVLEEEDEADEMAEAPDEADETAETEPSPTPSSAPTDTPTPAPSPTPQPASASQVVMVEVSEIGDVLENGGFEAGFGENGVGLEWQTFETQAVDVNFSPESSAPFLQAGDHAQRISVDNAYQPDQYGGIYQTVEVVPGEPYTLTIYGQIRSGFGSVQSSSYGYRVQYAIDPSGEQNWRAIPQDDWVELPWPEQSLNVSNVTFSQFSTQIVPANDELTLFVRAWNKWPDGSLGEYTLDSLSLVGPIPGSVEMIAQTTTGADAMAAPPAATGGQESTTATTGSEEAMIDQPLPVTGNGQETDLLADGRFWLGVMVLILLTGGALTRARWGW